MDHSFSRKGSVFAATIMTLTLTACFHEDRIERRYAPQVESASFYRANYVWLVTFQGDLIKSDDGGAAWRTIGMEQTGGFDSITFIDERNGWASTKDGQVLRSSDGGDNWVSIAKPSEDRYGAGLGQIKFLDESHGWIVHALFFWRTEDGGTTWQRYPSPSATRQPVDSCFFIDPLVGWLSGSGGSVYHTVDGGKTWQEATVVNRDRGLSEVSFVDPLVGWVAASPRDGIYRTVDGGKTWAHLEEPREVFYLWSIQFISSSEGWVAGAERENAEPVQQKPLLLHTTNSGQSWARVKAAEDQPFVHRVYFSDSENGWLLSRDNVYRTQDGGKTWRVVLRLPPVAKK